MRKAKVFIFAPSDPTGESHTLLAGQGCERVLGKASWDTPQWESRFGGKSVRDK